MLLRAKSALGPDLMKIGCDRTVLYKRVDEDVSWRNFECDSPFASHQAPVSAHLNTPPTATPTSQQASWYCRQDSWRNNNTFHGPSRLTSSALRNHHTKYRSKMQIFNGVSARFLRSTMGRPSRR
jgi:hypothetical protein